MKKVTGKLKNIGNTQSLLIYNREVELIEFQLTTAEKTLTCFCESEKGTAYHTLQFDQRFRNGVVVIAIGTQRNETDALQVTALRLADTADVSGPQEADIAKLKDKAMANLALTRGELHALLGAFEANSPQAYAIAVQLRRQHSDKTLPIADKVCRCTQCKAVFELESPRHTYAWGKTRCNTCNENVSFDLVDPLPREAAESEKLDWQEVQRRLENRFGGGKK